MQNTGCPTYYKTDTHWNYGAAKAYVQRFLQEVNLQQAYIAVQNLIVEGKEIEFVGDLGKLSGATAETVVDTRIKNPCSEVIFHGNIINEGHIRHSINRSGRAVASKILVIHDSFTHWLFELISEVFSEVLYIHTPDIDFSFIKNFSPQYVFFIQAERFFPRILTNEITFSSMLRSKSMEKSVQPVSADYLDNLLLREIP